MMFEYQNDDQHQTAQRQIVKRRIISYAVSSAEIVDAHTNQGKSDRHHDASRNHRREISAQRFQKCAQNTFKQSADQGRTHDRSVTQNTAAEGGCNTLINAQKT